MPEEIDRAVADTSPLLERTALKEWAVLCDAMARGELIAMVRKGGIREQRAGFSVRHQRFLLYPTHFHEKAAELQPRFRASLAGAAVSRPADGMIALSLVAQVVAVWAVADLERLRAIEREHGLAWSAVKSRFEYKNRPGVQVVAVRVSRLSRTVTVPELRRYQGCVSWVALEKGVNVSDVQPVMAESAIATRLAAMHEALGAPETGR